MRTANEPARGLVQKSIEEVEGALGGEVFEDIVWVYRDPIAECPKIKDLLCFYNEAVDDIYVDGAAVPKVRTKWSRD